MKKGYLLLAGLAVAVVVIVLIAGSAKVISADTEIQGDYTIDSPLRLTDGAQLTINGNLTVSDEILCKNGPLRITVNGDAFIKGTLNCIRSLEADGDTAGIELVVTGNIEFSKDAYVIANSDVQIVSSAADLITTQEAKDAQFDEAGQDSGEGTRLGPLTENGKVEVAPTRNGGAVQERAPLTIKVPFIHIAKAQEEPTDNQATTVQNVIIRGNWYIGNGANPPAGLNIPVPPKKVNKILLNFNFGDKGDVHLENFYLSGPDGRGGEEANGSCKVIGGNGEDAFRMRLMAANVSLNDFTLKLGDGGAGGRAETSKDCENAVAKGGDGGQAGNFKMTATGKIEIQSFTLFPGTSGGGGEAIATGKDGVAACPGGNGGDATATGGNGGANKKSLAALGSVSGIANITIDPVTGGNGGDATATPGKGGDGNKCGCDGGKGGAATATAGKGGDAMATAPVPVTSQGGDGGDATATGGQGGAGGSCGPENKGGSGGAGGSASATFGVAGSGQTAGADGKTKDQTGGNGGAGGDGCTEGAGGAGGAGQPVGVKGADGKNLCAEPKKSETSASATTKTTVKVISYNGKYLPVDQLIIESEKGCDGGQAHWHAAQGVVTATDGSYVPDPGPQCGYGKTKDKPVMEVQVEQTAPSGGAGVRVQFNGEFR